MAPQTGEAKLSVERVEVLRIDEEPWQAVPLEGAVDPPDATYAVVALRECSARHDRLAIRV